jgi:hypothetical protein
MCPPAIRTSCAPRGRSVALPAPAEKLQPNTGLGQDLLEDAFAIARIPDRGGDKWIQLIDTQAARRIKRLRNRADDTIDALLGYATVDSNFVGQPCLNLNRMDRQWWRAGTGVHHLELGCV